MRVLAHITYAKNIQPEPVATQALAHILNGSTCLAEEFLSLFRPVGVEIVLGKVAPEKPLDKKDKKKGIPDLTILDGSRRRRFLVENKFWTGLRNTQPVSYLNELTDEEGFALLFIVPSGRVSVVWKELTARCREASLPMGEDTIENGTIWARVGARTLLITSWDHVLKKLQIKAEAEGLEGLKQDIIQLDDLARQEDSVALLPLRADEVTDQAIPRRLENYVDLALAIAATVANQHEAAQLIHGTNDHEIGRYIRYGQAFDLWLGISITVWRTRGISPLWCHVAQERFANVDGLIAELEELPELTHHGVYVTPDGLYIPVQLELGAVRDVLIDDATSKIEDIVNVLLQHVQQ